MKTKEQTRIIDRTVEALRKAAIELEEFQVKASLGKAELEDKYEDLKKNFNLFIHESKFKIKKGKEKYEEIQGLFDELIVQLKLGKAESIDAFKEQKKNLLLKLHEIEVKIKSNENFKRIYDYLLIEIEILKVQLEILEKKLEKGKDVMGTSFEKGKRDFLEFIEQFNAKHTEEKEETKWEHFQGEISEAFAHFKNAFSKS